MPWAEITWAGYVGLGVGATMYFLVAAWILAFIWETC